MRCWKIVFIAILAIAVADFFDSEAYARRGGGFSSSRSSSRSSGSSTRSSSRSSGSSTRSSRSSSWGSSRHSTPSRSSNWGSQNRSSTSRSGFSANTSRTTTTKPVRSSADQALYNKANSAGTAYSSKTQATKAFKDKYSDQYTSRYETKPTTRPKHIPETTQVGGKTYNITYNPTYGGYGYMGSNGRWTMYDTMADAAMVSMLMRRNNYYYSEPSRPVTYVNSTSERQTVSDGSGSWLFWFGIFVIAIIIILAVIASQEESFGHG